jgi:hypothetical protein
MIEGTFKLNVNHLTVLNSLRKKYTSKKIF